jgi:hypothetical protein
MSLLSDAEGLLSKYAGPVLTYVYSLVGLQGANAFGLLGNSVGTAAVASFIPAGVHLVHDVANDLKGLAKDAKAVEAAAAPVAQDTVA